MGQPPPTPPPSPPPPSSPFPSSPVPSVPPRRGEKEPGNGKGRDEGATPTRAASLPAYGFFHWLTVFLLLGLFGWFYVWTAERLIEQSNQDPLRSDQKHNMKLALIARDFQNVDAGAGDEERPFSRALWEWFPHYTDGVVNPLWPWAAAWVAPEGMTPSAPDEVTPTDMEFFRRGKWLNVTVTGVFLLLLGMTLARSYSILGMLNLVLLAGLGALLPRAVFFQPEPLYFVFFFLSWVTAIAILKENRLWLYPALGLVAGLAYLAKTSIAPLLLVFLLVSTYRFVAVLFPRLLGIRESTERAAGTWSCRNHVLGLVILAFAYLATTGPRLDFAYRQFGDPFHSYPKYWMWMDDFPSGYAWMGEHPGKAELEAIPEEERPSVHRYLADHTGQAMIDRMNAGLERVLGRFFDPPRRRQDWDDPKPWKFLLDYRGHYLAWLALMLLVMGILYTRHRRASVFPSQRLQPAAIPIVLFVVGVFAVYALAYAWYSPIGRGERFMLSLYAPLAASLIAGSESILLRVRRRGECLWIIRVYGWLQLILTLAIAYRIVQLVRLPQFDLE